MNMNHKGLSSIKTDSINSDKDFPVLMIKAERIGQLRIFSVLCGSKLNIWLLDSWFYKTSNLKTF